MVEIWMSPSEMTVGLLNISHKLRMWPLSKVVIEEISLVDNADVQTDGTGRGSFG
jgi:hypothetical protein